MDAIEWIRHELSPKVCTSEELFYDHMESQSDYCLPIIYQPFDTGKRSHWGDRGALFDFLLSIDGHGKDLLDFGPGDGWPSLIVAPFAAKVIGVEGSRRRVSVCIKNAERLGAANAEFLYVEPGARLPFGNNTFDGGMAASSIEQTPDPKFTLQELHRILKPGGRFRIRYEDLDRYRDGKEREIAIQPIDETRCKLILYDRDIDGERATMYGITLSMTADDLRGLFSGEDDPIPFSRITGSLLAQLHPKIIEAQVCTLSHPSGKTLVEWLRQVGFSDVVPTHNGIWFAQQLFDCLPKDDRPEALEALDALLRPLIKIVVEMPAPISLNPAITAIK